jgi:DNA processing protein
MLACLRLIRSRRVGPGTFQRLIAEHGNAADALDALPQIARASGLSDYTPCTRSEAEAEIDAARAIGAVPLVLGDPLYPALLAGIPDAPPFLWCRGDPSLLSRPSIALVGARNASSLGLRTARALAAGLGSAGRVIVSGLARGIDAAAHAAALDTGTVAVLAGGVDVIYPAENAPLAAQITERGALVSEQPMGLVPQARHFPRRNRVISGLCAGVVVVEGASRSGSLITARDALDQGREVMAVPGHPFDARASGCNALIRDGATLVRDAADVLAATAGIDPTPPAARPERASRPAPQTSLPTVPAPNPASGDLRADILACLGPSPIAEDQLIRDLARPAAQVAPELLLLELDGRIVRHRGGLLALAN